MTELPAGTVAFLFTAIDGGTVLWESDPEAMQRAAERQLVILRDAAAAHGGHLFKTIADGAQVAFPTAAMAVAAAIDAQRALEQEPWPLAAPLRVRMAVHVGEATPRDGDYLAPSLNRLARLLGLAHGRQILLTSTAAALARQALPADTTLRDLGVHRLRDLLEPEPVFQVLHPGLWSDFPALASLDARLTNLPRQPTPFIGREAELAEVVRLFRDDGARMVTLIGPGGAGKTRLALQAAADLVDGFPDGVYLVPLASVTDGDLVLAAIASELKVQEIAGLSPRDLLIEALAGRTLLLVLDNLEQIRDAGRVVADLLAAAPRLSVLATSRTPLRLRAEREYAVPPLPLPPEQLAGAAEAMAVDAIRLFVERAQAVRPDFVLTDDDAASVAEIVRRLDGLPLAIELAAARIRLFAPKVMLARLDQRLPLLTGGARDLPARQRALRETVAWSYDLLGGDEQALFRQLAVFRGGCTLEAAEAVADPELVVDPLMALERLVEHSLIQTIDVPTEPMRFRMLETIREFALECLEAAGSAEATRERHAHYHLALAEEAARALENPNAESWLDRLEAEHDNLRAALEWSGEQEGESLARLSAALGTYWEIRGHFAEGREWLERALPAAEDGPQERFALLLATVGSIARLQGDAGPATERLERALAIWQDLGERLMAGHTLMSLGHVAERLGDLARAREQFTQALEIGRQIGNPTLEGNAHNNLGIVADQQGEYATAARHYEEALAIYRRAGDRRRESNTLNNLGNVSRAVGELETAQRQYEAAIAVSREVGDAWGAAGTEGNLGLVALQMHDLERAWASFQASLDGFRELGDRRGVAVALDNLGLTARAAGALPRAAALHGEGLALSQELRDRIGVAFGLEGIGIVADDDGKSADALRLLGAADALRESIGAPLPPDNRSEIDRAIDAARAELGDAACTAAWQAGRGLSMEEAIADALALVQTIAHSAAATI